MPVSDVRLTLPDGDQPAFLRIAEAIVAEIRRGRLQPGQRLPGTRALAVQLGVHRNTVTAAVRELRAQGWVRVHPRGRTEVASLPAAPVPAPRVPPAAPPFRVAPVAWPDLQPQWPPGTLVLAGGRPDLRQLPVDELGRAWRAAVRHSRGRILDYGAPEGHPRLRAAIAALLGRERGLTVGPDEVFVTRGSQQALYLVARALIRPGDRVAVERLGYPPAWAAWRAAGAELVPVDVDGEGMRVDRLEGVPGLRAVYCTPHHQYPTMVTLPAARRLALAALARERGFAVVEDDYDNEFHYRGRPVLPLAAHDVDGAVVYVGTFSKTLAPGLRLGFLVAHRDVIRAVAALRLAVDRQGDAATELAVATLVEDGTVGRHLRRMRRLYASRQALVADRLAAGLGERIAFEVPAGGLALWVRTTVEPEAWQLAAARHGVGFDVARRYHLDGTGLPYVRIGFASLDEDELVRAVDGLVASHPGLR
ncbi:MAG: PLP-dependent aminotransferase family protein [Myxococcota bacterium]